jgi:hypothetical protein
MDAYLEGLPPALVKKKADEVISIRDAEPEEAGLAEPFHSLLDPRLKRQLRVTPLGRDVDGELRRDESKPGRPSPTPAPALAGTGFKREAQSRGARIRTGGLGSPKAAR